MGFMEVSAKTGVNVEEVFDKLARDVNKKRDEIQNEIEAGGVNLCEGIDEQSRKNCQC